MIAKKAVLKQEKIIKQGGDLFSDEGVKLEEGQQDADGAVENFLEKIGVKEESDPEIDELYEKYKMDKAAKKEQLEKEEREK